MWALSFHLISEFMNIKAIQEIDGYQFGSVKLETEKSGEFCAVFTGYGLFKIDGKKYRRKLLDIKLYNEYRYAVRYKNKVYFLPFNIGSELKD